MVGREEGTPRGGVHPSVVTERGEKKVAKSNVMLQF